MTTPSPVSSSGSSPVAGLSRRRFLAAGAAGVAVPFLLRGPLAGAATGSPKAFGFPPTDLTSKVTRPMTFPVAGEVTWTDTYGACRDGCSRQHEGQDLMGTKLEPLVACVDGTVAALHHASDGNYLYLEDKDGWYYGYLHINNDDPGTDDGKNPLKWAFAPGLAEGSTVTAGQFIAYLGDSGNAEDAGAHCHFEVRRPASGGVWHSQAVNPKYSLQAATPAPAVTPGSPATQATPTPHAALSATGPFVPWATAAGLVSQQYQDFLGRPPTPEALALYQGILETKQHTPAWFVQSLLDSDENQRGAGALARLYRAYFRRDADTSGFTYWLTKVRAKSATISAVSDSFARSPEFVRTFGLLTDSTFVSTVYQSVLGRDADRNGLDYWVGQLQSRAVTRGQVMLAFSESSENRAALAARTRVILLYGQMLQKIPAASIVQGHLRDIQSGATTTQKLIDQIRLSHDYGARFA